MSMQLHSDFIQLDYCLDVLHKKKATLSSNLDVMITSMEKRLHALDLHSKSGFTPLTQRLKADITQVLINLHTELATCEDKHAKISQLRRQILHVQSVIAAAPLLADKKVQQPKIGLSIGFFCDLDCLDHNRAISSKLIIHIQQNLPFITTRSLLKGTGITAKNTMQGTALQIEKLLLDTRSQWEIFQQLDAGQATEFVLFLPKSLVPTKTAQDKLRALDFATDGSLQPISLAEALQEPQGKGHIEDFFKLFVADPKVDKLFYIAGHGDSSSVAALNADHYLKFLDFLESQRCQGLSITSCCAGGKSSLLNIPTLEETDKPLSFDRQIKDRTFTTIVRSIGDFPTDTQQNAEADSAKFSEELIFFLENTPKTTAALGQLLEKVEGYDTKSSNNFVKVYFPHSGAIPAGFRPVDEQKSIFTLTYRAVKQAELKLHKSRPLSTAIALPAIAVKAQSFVAVHPLVSLVQLTFLQNDPILLSMLPGNGHHFVQTLQLAALTPREFIQNTLEHYRNEEIQMCKGFFIGSINSATQAYTEVVIFLTPDSTHCVYRTGEQYFFTDGVVSKPISAFQHALIFAEVNAATLPKKRRLKLLR